MDEVAGTAGNDKINASNTTLTALDAIDGGAGTDTLTLIDATAQGATSLALASSFTVTGVENLNVISNQNIGKAGLATFDVSGFTGLTSAKFVATGTANGSQVKVAGTTDASLTVAAGDAVVSGGKAVTVTNAGAGTSTVSGSALSSVSVRGGGAVSIDNTAAGVSAAGKSLTSVSLDGTVGAVKGAGIATLNLSNLVAASDVTVSNATTAHGLTLNLTSVGYDTAGDRVAVQVFDAAAKSITINSNDTSAVGLGGNNAADTVTTDATSALRTVVITGAGDVRVDMNATTDAAAGYDLDNNAATSIDASAATGAVTLVDIAANVVSIKGGSGVDTFAVTATTDSTVTTGAGNDRVTLSGALTAKSSVDLGAGNDRLTVSTAYADGATIAGGDGTDTLVASKAVYATLAGYDSTTRAKVTGFEALTISDVLTGTAIDASKIAGVNATVTLADGLTSATTLSGLASGSSVVIAGTARTNSALTATVTGAVTATSDVLTVTGAVTYTDNNNTSSTTTTATVAVTAAKVETINLVASGTLDLTDTNSVLSLLAPVAGYKADTVTTTFNLTGSDSVTTIAISGNQKAVLATTAAQDQLAVIDASANTGGVTIDGSLSAATSAALTIRGSATAANTLTGGFAADTLVGGAAADQLNGGAGADTLTGGAGNDTLTGGTGADALSGGTGRDVFAFATGTTADSVRGSTGFDKISDFGVVSTALTATQSDDLSATVATAQAATTNNGGANADILDVAGTAAIRAAAAITQADGSTMTALSALTGTDILVTDDIKFAVSAKGVISLTGVDAGKVNTISEWTTLVDNIDGTTAGTTSAFSLNGNTYVQVEGGTDADTLVELTGLTLGATNGLALLSAAVAVSSGDILFG